MIHGFFQSLVGLGQFSRAFPDFDFQVFMRFQQRFFRSLCLRNVFKGFYRSDNRSLGISDDGGSKTQPFSSLAQFREKVRRFICTINQF